MKTALVGHSSEAEAVKEDNTLNRTVRATTLGWEYECDPRHVEVLVGELGFIGAKPLSSPVLRVRSPLRSLGRPCLGMKRPVSSARLLPEAMTLPMTGLTPRMTSRSFAGT